MRIQRSHTPQLRSILPCIASAALALPACGADGSGGGGSGGGERAEFGRAALEHAECMRKQGIHVPDPKPGQGGIVLRGPEAGGDPAAERRAARKCERHLRDVPPPRLNDEQKAVMRDGALGHARCMRRQGIAFPDPSFDENGGVSVKIGGDFDPGDPRVRRVEQRCRKHLPMPDGEPLE